jgi:hypothetical protein
MLTKSAAVAFLIFMSPMVSRSSELNLDTLQAWDKYVAAEDACAAERSTSEQFLWSDGSADRNRRIRAGEIIVSPASQNVPQSVAHGLIHHWIGATFLPNVHLDDVLAVINNYARYKEFYAPMVIDSKPLSETDTGYEFSMVMLNKAVLSKVALDGTFEESHTRISERRWYSVAHSITLQEIANYAQAGQRKLPPDTGSGYIWRLHSISRLEERDGGVYVELEAMALSRDVPGSLRWLVNPIVRRVSRGSLLVSLRKTQDAVLSTTEASNDVRKDKSGGFRTGGFQDQQRSLLH